MYFYRQSITLFGIVLPLIAAAGLAGIGVYFQSRVTSSMAQKEKSSRAHNIGLSATYEMEKRVILQRPHLERWSKFLSQETASTVTSNLREISDKLPPKEIQLTAFDPSASGGIGAASMQKSSQLRIALRGTFRTMQQAFLELETRMPQLQLQELRMDATSTQSSLVNFQVSYTAWEE